MRYNTYVLRDLEDTIINKRLTRVSALLSCIVVLVSRME